MGFLEELQSDDPTYPAFVGYICAVIAVLGFGTNFAPVKKFETGDGMFFQWVFCASIWFCGLAVQVIQGFPTFYPLVMLGGFLWATGNIMVVPVIKTIGMGQGILIWGSANLLAGWATGRFGLFGLNKEIPNNTTLNYIGVGLCILSGVIYFFIKTEIQTRVESASRQDDQDPLVSADQSLNSNGRVVIENGDEMILDRLSDKSKRIVGFTLSIISGLLYGNNFNPAQYVQDHYEGASKNGLDYVFAQFCGIFATSTAYFLIYCGVMGNHPRVYPRAILPGFISGVLWSIADIGWFIANATLSDAVAFPIITSGPGIVAALWGVFAFGEIKGKRNYLILAVAAVVCLGGGICTGFSKS